MMIQKQAVQKYGKEKQIVVAIEELAELSKELCKELRGMGNQEHIAEEMADVKIMLEELDIIFGNTNKVLGYKISKLERLRERLKHEN